jgi:catechol 2,3-dioxygenase-like lactoylglutathione lyase family enzyme
VLDHVTIRASDREASERFYDTALPALGIERSHGDAQYAEWGDFSVMQAGAGNPATRRLHIGFAAPSRAAVEEFWRIGTAAGHPDDGAPGPRPQYTEDYFGAFLLDPDGNSAEAVHHGSVRHGRTIDHLWIRVADLAASRGFYATIAPHAGLRLARDTPERARFANDCDSFSVVPGPPTEHLHMAFAAEDDATVDAFHAVATAAGYRDNGAPGERPIYHAGYYSAFVLDPDGNNIELVNHNR